ncbi:hypothetical protein Trydic_g12781 [Trypoxylus dichotomus]
MSERCRRWSRIRKLTFGALRAGRLLVLSGALGIPETRRAVRGGVGEFVQRAQASNPFPNGLHGPSLCAECRWGPRRLTRRQFPASFR